MIKAWDWTTCAALISISFILGYILLMERQETPTYFFQKRRRHIQIRSVKEQQSKRSIK